MRKKNINEAKLKCEGNHIKYDGILPEGMKKERLHVQKVIGCNKRDWYVWKVMVGWRQKGGGLVRNFPLPRELFELTRTKESKFAVLVKL